MPFWTRNKVKKLASLSLVLVVLVFVLTAFFQPSISVVVGENAENSYLLKSTVRYDNPSPNHVWNFAEREEDRTIGLFMNNSWQTVKLLNSTFPVETFKNDSDGNSIAVLQFPEAELLSGENLSFVVWYEIKARSRAIPSIVENESGKLDEIDSALVPNYTAGEGSWQTGDVALMQLALDLKGNETNVLAIVENFIGWIVNHVVYPQTLHEVPYYPTETYSKLEGDCDDQAILLITLCRIVGIPAYLQVGCIYLPNKPLKEDSYWDNRVTYVQRYIGWHGWAMVYVPPWGWLPVDLTYVSQSPKNDPLNAIKYGAITSPTAVQFENVTHADYVASSYEARSFVIQSGFEVFAEDEMLIGSGQTIPEVVAEPWSDWVPVTFAALTIFLIGVVVFAIRKWNKRY